MCIRDRFGDTALELVYDQAFTGGFGTSTRPLNIGFTEDGNDAGIYYFNGYITDFRYTVGTALTTGVTTIPSAAVDAIDTNTKFLFKSSSKTFVDSSSSPHTVSTKSTPSIEAWSPYTSINKQTGFELPSTANGGSIKLDGSGDYVSTSGDNVDFGTTSTPEFTLEAWVYPTTTPQGTYA